MSQENTVREDRNGSDRPHSQSVFMRQFLFSDEIVKTTWKIFFRLVAYDSISEESSKSGSPEVNNGKKKNSRPMETSASNKGFI